MDGRWFMIPEVAEWSELRLFELGEEGATELAPLDVEFCPHVLDPTLTQGDDGAIYLFGNLLAEPDILRLWISDNLFGHFREHPASPIRMSPLGSRMGGAIFKKGGQSHRLGQDCEHSYGKGIVLFGIEALTRTLYRERYEGRLSFDHVSGPHTLNFDDDLLIFDFYRERLSPFAGLRRLRASTAKRRARRLSEASGQAPSPNSPIFAQTRR
jgi:hypothetical protein